MNRSAVAIALGLLATFAAVAVALFAREPQPQSPVPQTADPAHYFDQSAATGERIRALEAAVAEERNARLLLEEELQALYSEIEALRGGESGPMSDEEMEAREEAARRELERAQERARRRQPTADQSRIERLTEHGFAPDRAEWLIRRESALGMEALRARYEARMAGEPIDPSAPALSAPSMLRAEIGDAEYEQYRLANGWPTVVEISNILESSPAQQAGLQAGDQIVSYNGTRVFDVGELNRFTMGSEPGGSVIVDIVRDGVPMQVVMPSGPIGVSISGRRGR
jgi:hypothetical protein